MNDIVNELAALVGRDNVAADPASLEEYAQDESFVPRLTPWAVVRPGSAEEVQQVVAWANETATPLVPVSSGGPHFHGDTVPSVPGAVMVDLRRMDKILRVDRRNRMVVIEPGVTYPQLQAALAERGHARHAAAAARGRTSPWSRSLLERQPTLIPRYNFHLPEPLRNCGVVWGNGETMFTGEAGIGPRVARGPVAGRRRAGRPQGPGADRLLPPAHRRAGHDGRRHVGGGQVRARSPPPTSTLFAAAAELEELVDFTYRLDRLRLGDEVLIVNDAYLARLLAAGGAAVDPDACPRGRSSSASAAASTSPPSASRSRRRTPRRWPASSA